MNEPTYRFAGFASPNGTIVPDAVFDELLVELTDAELRVLLYIIRRTFGWKKEADTISLKQMAEGIRANDGHVIDRGTGMAKSACARGIKGLLTKGVISATRNSSPQRGDLPTAYALRFAGSPVSSKGTGGVLEEDTGGVLEEDTQPTTKTTNNWTENSNNSNSCPRAENVDNLWITSPHALGERPAMATPEIDALITDLSRQFSDLDHLRSNLQQARNLAAEFLVGIDTFFTYAYEARARTRQTTGVEKRMAYFFRVLRALLEGRETLPDARRGNDDPGTEREGRQ